MDFESHDPAIWIDTLLVPVEKGHEKRVALSQLYDYYQRAEKVLVLDSDLLRASRNCSREEILTRIFFSTWMRRLWTLEEGVLSRNKLIFQFRDGPINLNDVIIDSKSSESLTGMSDTMQGNLFNGLPNVANYYRHGERECQTEAPIFAGLLPALLYRSTSKAIDEPLCIAHILGLEASKLVTIDQADFRMKELLIMLAEHGALFPVRLLFTNVPKIRIPGFRWAALSLMGLGGDDAWHLRSENDRKLWTTFSEKGLLISGMSAFTLDFSGEQIRKITFVAFDRRIYALSPVAVHGTERQEGRFWTAKTCDKALNVDPNED